MSHPLRSDESPRALAAARQSIDFESTLQDFDHLVKVVASDLEMLDEAEKPAGWRQAAIAGHLSFDFADLRESVPAVTGRAEATLDAVCQRCLQAFKLPLQVALNYVLVTTGEGNDAPGDDIEGYEAWELAEDRLRVGDLVEEALIMALPMSAAHATIAECGPLAGGVKDEQSPGVKMARPFAGLKDRLAKKE